jgi:Tol biopolymer transport system component
MRVGALFVIGVLCLTGCSCECDEEVVEPAAPATGPYLGQQPPGATPELFLATSLGERDTAWTPDGTELYFSIWERRHGYLATRAEGPAGWSEPAFAPFSLPRYPELEPFITADGQWLYFISKRPLPDGGEPDDFNLWRAPRIDEGWGAPELLPDPVSSEHEEFYPSLTTGGDLYFTSDRPGGLGGEDIWRTRWTGDGWAEPENLGPSVNSPGPEFNSLIAPDGSWLIFGSVREGDVGGGDLHIAFRGRDGGFLPSVNMGEPVNSGALDYCPALSPDGSILFFTSSRVPEGDPDPATLDELEALANGPSNGRDNIWWVSSRVIEDLRPGG